MYQLLPRNTQGTIETPKRSKKCPTDSQNSLKYPKGHLRDSQETFKTPLDSKMTPNESNQTPKRFKDSLESFIIKGGFQLLDLIIPELKSHVIPYRFKCSHWWKHQL